MIESEISKQYREQDVKIHAWLLLEWLQDPKRKPAIMAFTEGPLRVIAASIERAIATEKESNKCPRQSGDCWAKFFDGEKEAQHHIADASKMVAPAVPLPVAYLYHDASSAELANPLVDSTLLVMRAQRMPSYRNETPLVTLAQAEAYANAKVAAALASQPKPAPVLLTDEEFSKIRATSLEKWAHSRAIESAVLRKNNLRGES